MNISSITNLVEEHLAGSDKFLVEVFIKPINRIYVFIDGDQGVTISDCVALSRHIESSLDRETEDFELNVSSSGADYPITLPRQYLKNTGRSLNVTMNDERVINGKLEAVGETGITLITKGDKKKKLPPETLSLPFTEIKESKVIISFK
jgi:ribosome maturation factor RimP